MLQNTVAGKASVLLASLLIVWAKTHEIDASQDDFNSSTYDSIRSRLHERASFNFPNRVAVIGEGVIGLSTATAILELAAEAGVPPPEITIIHHKPFDKILSRQIAGLFRIDDGTPINKKYGYDTFQRLASLWREKGGLSGVQLVSGHILSDNPKKFDSQRDSYGSLVYNYRDLTAAELYGPTSLFDLPTTDPKRGIHYTAYTSEGFKYCPFMKNELRAKGVRFVQRKLKNLDEVGVFFDTVVNAAGLYGGVLAGDDAGNVYPIRGVLVKVDAPWQKHFLYKEFDTFTIPVIDTVYVGTVKQVGAYAPSNATLGDYESIFTRYLKLQPSFKDVPILSSYVGYRPGRKQIRVEKVEREIRGKKYTVVHNYGHGGNGFTLGYGSAIHAARLVLNMNVDYYNKIVPNPLPPNSTVSDWVEALDA